MVCAVACTSKVAARIVLPTAATPMTLWPVR
jgi:hypothetical protein